MFLFDDAPTPCYCYCCCCCCVGIFQYYNASKSLSFVHPFHPFYCCCSDMMPVLLLLRTTVVVTLGTYLFLFCMCRCLFARCFDRLIARFFGIVAVGGRRGYCWKEIPKLLLPLLGKYNDMMLLDRDWKGPCCWKGMQLLAVNRKGRRCWPSIGRGCNCWTSIGRDVVAGQRSEGTPLLDRDWKGRCCWTEIGRGVDWKGRG